MAEVLSKKIAKINGPKEIQKPKELLEKIPKAQKQIEEMQKAQKKPVKYVVFSGGGAKGSIYAGVYAALKKLGLFNNLEAVAGSSAGAITAALAATGTTPERFEEISKTTNMQELLGKKGVSIGPVQINKDGKPLYDLLHETLQDNIKNFLKREDIVSIKGNNALDELRARFNNKNEKVYFKDIALLRKYDPVTYKELVITATQKDTGELTIFNSIDTPNIEIALACRASASIPVVFEPVKINGKTYVDGGYLDNIPTKYFQDNEQEVDIKELKSAEEVEVEKEQGRTLAMAFGSGMKADANIAIYSAKKFESPSQIIKFLVNIIFKELLAQVGGNFKYTDTLKKTKEELRENALNTIVLDTQGIDTLDFNDAQKYADYLYNKGYCQTIEHCENFELGAEADKTFEHQKFLLNVYEVYNAKSLNKTLGTKLLEMVTGSNEPKEPKWKNNVIENQEDKAKMLLSFSNPNVLSEKLLDEKLKEFVIVAGVVKDNKLQEDTKAMKALISTLNNPQTPDKLKHDFKQLLGVDKNANKFTEQDFKKFLETNKGIVQEVLKKYQISKPAISR